MKGSRYQVPSTQSNQANTPSQSSQSSPVEALVSKINGFKGEMAKVLPKFLTPEKMARILTTEVRKNPKLAECTPMSFFGAVLQCAQLGLEPGGALGHVYLIPRKGEIQLTIGYQGMIELMERSKDLLVIAHEVYSNDMFKMTLGTSEELIHEPDVFSDRGKMVGVYAIAKYKDGRFKSVFLNLKQIEEARKSSSAGNSGPWNTHYEEMALKTAIRKLFKKVPKSQEIATVIEAEEKAERGETQDLHRFLAPEQIHSITSPSQDPFLLDTPAADISATVTELPQ